VDRHPFGLGADLHGPLHGAARHVDDADLRRLLVRAPQGLAVARDVERLGVATGGEDADELAALDVDDPYAVGAAIRRALVVLLRRAAHRHVEEASVLRCAEPARPLADVDRLDDRVGARVDDAHVARVFVRDEDERGCVVAPAARRGRRDDDDKNAQSLALQRSWSHRAAPAASHATLAERRWSCPHARETARRSPSMAARRVDNCHARSRSRRM
jgi:hypothetical protein